MKGLFVTGTDTGIGKTLVSCALLSVLKSRGFSAQGMKPIASGCERSAVGLRNDDAQQLIKHSSQQLPYSMVNPYAFEEAVAPHLVAAQSNIQIDIDVIKQQYRKIAMQCDHVVVEGVGGWLVPINRQQTMADLAISLQLPVIMVVGLRLGCINHALMTYQSIKDTGLLCLGWVANTIDPTMQFIDENRASIAQRLEIPLLGTIPYDEQIDATSVAQNWSLSGYLHESS